MCRVGLFLDIRVGREEPAAGTSKPTAAHQSEARQRAQHAAARLIHRHSMAAASQVAQLPRRIIKVRRWLDQGIDPHAAPHTCTHASSSVLNPAGDTALVDRAW